MESFLLNNSDYVQVLSQSSVQFQFDIFDTVYTMLQDFKNTMKLTLRLKKLVTSAQSLSASLILNNAMDAIISECCNNLQCDRASVFLIDSSSNQLWFLFYFFKLNRILDFLFFLAFNN